MFARMVWPMHTSLSWRSTAPSTDLRDLWLDLLYTGKTDQCGEIDHNKGQLIIRLLYVDLGLDPECGGLPDIAELDTIEDKGGGGGAAVCCGGGNQGSAFY